MAQWERIHLPVKETQETLIPSLSQEDSLEEEMATHSSILTWEIPWSEELVGYSLWGCRVRHDLATKQQQQGSFRGLISK